MPPFMKNNWTWYAYYETALTISNKEINDIMKLVKSLQESGLLIKGVSETSKNKPKEQKKRIFGLLLGT